MAFLCSNQTRHSFSKDTYGLNVNISSRIKADGFTLIEMMIVIAILATLIGIAVPLFSAYIDKAKVSRAAVEIRSIEKHILMFGIEHGRFPNNLAEIGLGGFKDPYGNPYQYMPAPIGNHGPGIGKMRKDRNLVPVNTDFDLYSMGKDGSSSTAFTARTSQDDIVRANNGQFVGLVSVY